MDAFYVKGNAYEVNSCRFANHQKTAIGYSTQILWGN